MASSGAIPPAARLRDGQARFRAVGWQERQSPRRDEYGGFNLIVVRRPQSTRTRHSPRGQDRGVGAADRRLHPHPAASAGQLPIRRPRTLKVLRCGRRFGKSEFGSSRRLRRSRPKRQWDSVTGRASAGSRRCTSTRSRSTALADAFQPVARAVNVSEMTITLPAGGVVEC